MNSFFNLNGQKVMNGTFPQEKYVGLSDDSKMYYYKVGSGDHTILLIHGLGSDKKAWLKLLPHLAEQFTVYAIDLNKYLDTEDTSRINLEAYTDSIHEFLEELKIEHLSICGHSMGGQLAVKFALTYPKRTDHLILLAPAGLEIFNEAERKWFETFITKDFYLNLSDDQIKRNFEINFYSEELPQSAAFMLAERLELKKNALIYERYIDYILASIHSMLDESIYDDLPSVHVPTLVVFGKNDQLIPNQVLHPNLTVEDILRNAEYIPGAETLLIEKAGHFVQWDQALLLSEKIEQFIQVN